MPSLAPKTRRRKINNERLPALPSPGVQKVPEVTRGELRPNASHRGKNNRIHSFFSKDKRLSRGAGWTFKVRGGALKLDESLYLGRRGEVRRSEQLVVSGATDGEKVAVNWSFTRVGGPGKASDAPEGEG